ncbi:MAG TPA: glycoside hydrolase family 88 protein [Terriglobales bacterium]|nr:glycoside hydrolase family 88 protein [Terriglobales bacterium]
MLTRTRQLIALATILLCQSWLCFSAFAQTSAEAGEKKPAKNSSIKELKNWPLGTSPQEIGKRVVGRYVSSDYLNLRRNPPSPTIIYPEVCTWYGALTFAQLSADKDLTDQLIKRFDPLLGDKASLVPKPNHVDNTVFGAVPLELYIETKDQRYLDLGKSLADQQWQDPEADGTTKQTRFWIDDMYMITAVQVQAYRATHDNEYLNRAAHEMVIYLDKLQQPNGLFYHAPDVPFFWGRGNGWVAAGMTEMLRSMPSNHPDREHILTAYRKMLATLLKYQNADGTWNQLIDHSEAWPETSSTGMFTFAMITGVKNGWLDEKSYAPAARKAWLGLVHYIDANGDVSNVCEGTNKKNDLNYYLTRARNTGDLHGEAPILWSASALLR